MTEKRPVAVLAAEMPVRALKSNSPEPFAAQSALRDRYGKQNEFVYALEGEPTSRRP